MKYFHIGKYKISKYCLGTWSLGGNKNNNVSYGSISNKQVKKILEYSYERGINFFDTANVYGNSEIQLGNTFSKQRNNIFIANKVGCISYNKKLNFSKNNIENQISSSLKNLRTDYLDLVQLYNPNFYDKDLKYAIEYLDKLKNLHAIKYIGISLANPSDYFLLRKLYNFDTVQCNFNILDHRLSQKKLINSLYKDKVKIFARTILNFGIFSENFLNKKKIKFKKDDHRFYWNKKQINLWIYYANKIKNISKRSIENTCYKFCNSFNIDSLIIGATSINHITQAIDNKNYIKLKKNEINLIKKIYNEYSKYVISKPKIGMKLK